MSMSTPEFISAVSGSGTPPSTLTFRVDSGSLTTGAVGKLSRIIPLSAAASTYDLTFRCTNRAGNQVSSAHSIP